ncbi:hypothetical protein HDU87_006980 [Geranomyces variabilis]|uniref:Transmembrane protein n=1 Tax=Geranomyces variabilis TaxID=109894 RepID=A0AAD5TGD1_9FUNG|nr:hypothetical protein HDU87_006980 [Geranomyces variabilis]
MVSSLVSNDTPRTNPIDSISRTTNRQSDMKILISIALFAITLAVISAMASAAPPAVPDPLQQKKAGLDGQGKVFQTHFLVPDKGTASGLAGRDESGFHLEPVKARIGGYKLEGARSPVNVPDRKDAQ